MDFEEAITQWESEYMELVQEMRASRGDTYRSGYVDGMEAAIEGLRANLSRRKI